jgi:hypothetical protein
MDDVCTCDGLERRWNGGIGGVKDPLGVMCWNTCSES